MTQENYCGPWTHIGNGYVKTSGHSTSFARFVLEGDLDTVHTERRTRHVVASVEVGVELFEGLGQQRTSLSFNLETTNGTLM